MIWIAWAIALTACPVNLIIRRAGAPMEVQIIHTIVCIVAFILEIIYFLKNR